MKFLLLLFLSLPLPILLIHVCAMCVGMFVDSVVAVARKELAWETDYEREAQFSSKFRYTFLHLVRTESEDNYS